MRRFFIFYFFTVLSLILEIGQAAQETPPEAETLKQSILSLVPSTRQWHTVMDA